jgi:hypothetical protein
MPRIVLRREMRNGPEVRLAGLADGTTVTFGAFATTLATVRVNAN